MMHTYFDERSHRAMADGPPVRCGVLGPLAVWNGPEQTRIAPAKHRSVLAFLLVNVNQPVPIDAVVDELWTDDPPATARKTVQGYVWRLRSTLRPLAGALATVENGYRLELPNHALDSLEFSRLVSFARSELAARRLNGAIDNLTAALRLWRGPAFSCVPRTPTIAAHAAGLDEARVIVQELLIATALDLDRPAEVVPELMVLASAHPYRESVHRLLMTALHRTGRRSEALGVFTKLREALAAEHGLDPDLETLGLHRAILCDLLDGDPSTTSTSPSLS
jgi:SARP family transcriptional regulator, regulator of embCAB operon